LDTPLVGVISEMDDVKWGLA